MFDAIVEMYPNLCALSFICLATCGCITVVKLIVRYIVCNQYLVEITYNTHADENMRKIAKVVRGFSDNEAFGKVFENLMADLVFESTIKNVSFEVRRV